VIPQPADGEPTPVEEDAVSADPGIERRGMVRRGEVELASGVGLLGVTAYLAPQVMIGLLALMLTPVVLALLLIGVLRARNRHLPAVRQVVGLVLVLLGLSGLVVATGLAVETSAREARLAQIREDRARSRIAANPPSHTPDPVSPEIHAQVEAEMQTLARHPAHAPPRRHWIGWAAGWVAPGFMALGFYCWAGWSPWRCLSWGGVMFVFPHGVGRLIQAFGPAMVLSA
jgi:hypothetical protein